MLLRAAGLLACCWALTLSPVCQGGDDATREFKAQGLTLQIPESWKDKPTTNNLRLAQFEIPAAEGDTETAELVIFPPFGGSAAENIKRWVGQFESDGLKSDFKQGKCPQGSYVLADLSGTYNKPDGPPILRRTKPAPGYRMLSVMLTTEKEGSYFLKLTGPDKTVAAAAAAFRKAFGADSTQEQKFEF